MPRGRFTVRAPATEAFLSNQFDLFPSPIGKLLNARLAQCFHSLMVVSKRGRNAKKFPSPVFASAGIGSTQTQHVSSHYHLGSDMMTMTMFCNSPEKLQRFNASTSSPTWPPRVHPRHYATRLQIPTERKLQETVLTSGSLCLRPCLPRKRMKRMEIRRCPRQTSCGTRFKKAEKRSRSTGKSCGRPFKKGGRRSRSTAKRLGPTFQGTTVAAC